MSGGRDWTTTEVRELREWYPRLEAREIAAMLERSVWAVYRKASEVGVAEKDRRKAQRKGTA